jgi:uncharacterized membrane protein
MNRETATVALVLVTMLAVFVAIQPVLPSNSERFSEIGVLGPNQTIANYPTSLKAGQHFLLYGYVGNHEGAVGYYDVVIKLGNESTLVSNSTYADAPVLESFYHVLGNNQSWVFPMELAINQSGTNLRLIFELWMYNSSSFGYTGDWNQLWVNVTS